MALGPETLTAQEVGLLLAALLSAQTIGRGRVQHVRNWGMGVVMLEAGLRVGELVGLNVGDLVYAGAPVRMLVVRGEIAKGHKERQIPVSERLHGALLELMRRVWVTYDTAPGRAAFSCGVNQRRLTTRQVESIVRAAGLAALGRPVHPHVLRHTFGTRIERVAGIRVAQELLGHSDIRTTQMYCHPNGDDLKRAVNGLGRVPGVD
jgi:integrase/recombinase XerC